MLGLFALIGMVLWPTLAIVATYILYKTLMRIVQRNWIALPIALLTLLPFWLLPNDNWKRLLASREIPRLCAAQGGEKIFKIAENVDGLVIGSNNGQAWMKTLGLKYTEWKDQEGKMWRLQSDPPKSLLHPIDSFQAPYESKRRRETLQWEIVMEEVTVTARRSGEALGIQRGFWYQTNSGPSIIGFANLMFMVHPPSCLGHHYKSLESLTINPSRALGK